MDWGNGPGKKRSGRGGGEHGGGPLRGWEPALGRASYLSIMKREHTHLQVSNRDNSK